MPQIEIPQDWRKAVCEALATEARNRIEWKLTAEAVYEADATATKIRRGDSDPVWINEVYQPLRDFLSSARPTGCPITMDTPPGETYEFYFQFLGEKYYGKILLRTNRKQIVMFSAHHPLKTNLSCE